MEVSRNAPVSGNKQKALSLLTVVRGVFSANHIWFLSPDFTLAVGGAYFLFLPIGEVVDDNAAGTEDEDDNTECWTKNHRVVDHVEVGYRVEARDENKAPPADVESCTIHHNVDCTHVAQFPPEELREVHHMKENWDPHAVNKSVKFVTFQGKDKYQ